MIDRANSRGHDELRPLTILPGYLAHAGGSALIEMGETRVLCAASIEEQVPVFLKNSGSGWLTAEYSMLPAATPRRNVREATQGRQGGRTLEIQRLIGRSLRAVTDLTKLGERTIYIDCDVIQADGGTRTAAITGGFVALASLLAAMKQRGEIDAVPLNDQVAAVSVGLLRGNILLDLDYREDSRADVDATFVITGRGALVEVQVTAEGVPFEKNVLDDMIERAGNGIARLTARQREALGTLQ